MASAPTPHLTSALSAPPGNISPGRGLGESGGGDVRRLREGLGGEDFESRAADGRARAGFGGESGDAPRERFGVVVKIEFEFGGGDFGRVNRLLRLRQKFEILPFGERPQKQPRADRGQRFG